MPNPEDAFTSARIYTLDTGLGIWKGLGTRLLLPVLDITASTRDNTDRRAGLGDLAVLFNYQLLSNQVPTTWRLALGTGAYFPTGRGFKNDVPSNPNFVSGTVDPVLTYNGSYDFECGFGIFSHLFTRFVLAENDEKYRASSSVIYGGGFRYRIWNSIVPALGVTALHRFRDETSGVPVADTGGDWLFLNPMVSYMFMKGPLEGFSLFISSLIPLYQRVNAVQLAEDFTISAGMSYGFRLY